MAERRVIQFTPDDILLWNYAIYENPRDFPGKFVVRRWAIVRGGMEPLPEAEPLGVVDTIEAARALVPQGLYPLGRQEQDDAVIREVWI